MTEERSSISKARSYAKIGEFWDEHGLSGKRTKKVKFDVVLEPEATCSKIALFQRKKLKLVEPT
jgi:hypothetical protein